MTLPEDDDATFDADLIAYADGTLDPARLEAVEARLARDAAARDAVAQWRHHANLIREAARAADEQPASLRIAALERDLAAKLTRRRWKAALLGPGARRIAAGVVLFSAGWWTHGVVAPDGSGNGGLYPAYVEAALSGHSSHLFAASQRAEFGGDEMDRALDWLSERMQRKIDSPKLERLGYTVESARLVEADGRPVAVFYYRNPEDGRVTVSITPRLGSEPTFELRAASTPGGQMAYWSSDALHYAVVGDTSVAAITTLAAAVER